MHIGLIGGIGPAATDYYYRGLIKAVPDGTLQLTIAHADSPTLLGNLAAGDEAAQAAIFAGLAARLQAAGAEAVAVTAISGHFCIDRFRELSPLPVIDLLASVVRHVADAGYETVGILGTKGVMQSKLYGQLAPVNVVAPRGEMLDRVHDNYVAMAGAAAVNAAQRQVFFECGREMCARDGAAAVLLGGTDLFLAFDGQDCGFAVVDCAQLHMADIAKKAVD